MKTTIILQNEHRRVEITETIEEEYSLWQWKMNLMVPALKALTFKSDEEIRGGNGGIF